MAKERQNIVEQYLPVTDTWVATRKGQLVGFIALMGNEVGALFVDPRYHGAGFGFALMNKALELHAQLEVDVFKNNPLGRAFYERCGFHWIEDRIHEETGQPILRLGFTDG